MSFTTEITRHEQLSLEDCIVLVHANASDSWKQKADRVVRSLCASRERFTADDVLEGLDGEPCHDHRALGAVMQNASKAGLCRSTGQYVKSRLPQRHKRPVCIWESIIK